MTGSAVVTTRLSSATMKSASDVIANVQATELRRCGMVWSLLERGWVSE